MEKRKTISSPIERLTEARAENLKQIASSSLRPHGKMWGMDVFSWSNPLVEDLLTLFQSFPAPISWVGNHFQIENVFAEDENLLVNVTAVCAHDQVELKLSNNNFLEVSHGTKDVKSAFEFVKNRKQGNGIILFTASGNNWSSQRDDFETYLNIEQA